MSHGVKSNNLFQTVDYVWVTKTNMAVFLSKRQSTVDTNDWQVDKSVLECNKYMFEQQINCDVTFQCGGGKIYCFLCVCIWAEGGGGVIGFMFHNVIIHVKGITKFGNIKC